MKRILYILAMFAAVTAQAQVARVVTNGLVTWTPFEDASFGDRIGTNTAAVGTFVPGPVGKAMNLTSYRGIDNPPNPSTFTAAIWVRIKSHTSLSPGFAFFLQQWNTGSKWNWAFALNATTNLILQTRMSGGVQIDLVGPKIFVASPRWYHLAGTYSGGVQRFYVNGSFVGSASTSGTPLGVKTLFFCKDGDSYFGAAYGDFDDFRVYSRALSDQEIASLYNSRRPSP
ncbi:MAG: LamG domain-containing protein [Verrucomicrobiota bacterium]